MALDIFVGISKKAGKSDSSKSKWKYQKSDGSWESDSHHQPPSPADLSSAQASAAPRPGKDRKAWQLAPTASLAVSAERNATATPTASDDSFTRSNGGGVEKRTHTLEAATLDQTALPTSPALTPLIESTRHPCSTSGGPTEMTTPLSSQHAASKSSFT
jgi:hypothetical protein